MTLTTSRTHPTTERFPFEAWSRIYPGEYGAEVEIEIRQVFEPEGQARD